MFEQFLPISASYRGDKNTTNRRNPDGKTPLTSLIHDGDIDYVRVLLLNPGVDINYPEAQLFCGYRYDSFSRLLNACYL